MSDNLCLPKTHLLIILCVFMGFTVFYLQFKKKPEEKVIYKPQQIPQQIPPQYFIVKDNDQSFLEKRKALEYRDSQVKYNDFKPPERRVPEYIYPDKNVKQIINIPTRGYPDNYQMLGLLLRENTETVYNLFGRQTYPGSNQYEYYAQGNMHNNNVKLPIYSKGNRELNDGDNIRIPGTDENKGYFKVKLYNLDVPRYNPFDV